MFSIIASFLFFLLAFTLIGVYSSSRKKATHEDYLLASRDVNPYFTALSAVATNNSGFMFIGLIGFTYKSGISSIWIMVGWILGDYLAWRFVHKRLREQSEERRAHTIPSFLGNTSAGYSRSVVMLTGLITFIFLGTYAAAQLNAGSKALHVLFGWPYSTGAIIGAFLVLLYSYSGGIRASIWTDVAQSVVMFISMILLVGVALYQTGGIAGMIESLRSADPQLLKLIPTGPKYGFSLYLASWIAAGLGVVGQPHVMIRAMAIRSPEMMGTARRVYFGWYIFFTLLAIGVGLASRVFLSNTGAFDQELALPKISLELLPPVLVGMILAGLFAATMSTADSQVLSCSAALTQDLFPPLGRSYVKTKIGTAVVTLFILVLALFGDKSVFNLVVLSWSILASSLGPLLIVIVLKGRIHTGQSLAMILGGVITVLVWRYIFKFSDSIYDALPGMGIGFLIYGAGLLLYRFLPADPNRSPSPPAS